MGNPHDPGLGADLKTSKPALQAAFATLAAISWYNALELIILIFITFRQYRGLYFWSILVSASLGLIPYSLGFMLNVFKLCPPALYCTILTVGWYCMVTGQAVVLYSRLHLVLRNRFILHRVVEMICANVLFLHVPTTILTYGSNMVKNGEMADTFNDGYEKMEKIQMTGFCVQEFIISGLYIWETMKLIRIDRDRFKSKIMYQLVGINTVIICMDLGLLLIEYKEFYTYETMIKGVVYGIKLKLEFAVLGKLIHLVSSQTYKENSVIIHLPPPRHHHQSSRDTTPDFVDQTLTRSDTIVTVPESVTTVRRPVPGMDTDEIGIAIFEHGNNHMSLEFDRFDHDLESQSDLKSNPYSHDEYFGGSPPRKSPSTSESKVDRTTTATTSDSIAMTAINTVNSTDFVNRHSASSQSTPYEHNRKPD